MPGDYDPNWATRNVNPSMIGPPGSPGPTGPAGPPGPLPDKEVVRGFVREQTRFVVLDLLAGSDLEYLKPTVREIVREEMKAAMAEFFPERVKKPLRDQGKL